MNGGAMEVNSIGGPVRAGGIWYPGRRIGAKDIRDGLSHTYLAGEKAMNADKYHTGDDFGDTVSYLGWSFADLGLVTVLQSNSYVRYATEAQTFRDRANCLASCHDFGSAHASSWNVALADGAVRSMNYGLANHLHMAFGSIGGGETFSE